MSRLTTEAYTRGQLSLPS